MVTLPVLVLAELAAIASAVAAAAGLRRRAAAVPAVGGCRGSGGSGRCCSRDRRSTGGLDAYENGGQSAYYIWKFMGLSVLLLSFVATCPIVVTGDKET